MHLTHLFSQLGGDVIQDQLVMGEHQKLFPPSLQHVSDVLPEEAHTQSQLRSGAITMGRQKKIGFSQSSILNEWDVEIPRH